MIDFDFTPEQLALRDVARDLFEKVSPPSRLRAVWDADGDRDPDVWRAIAVAGIAGLTVPEAHGGGGGDEVDLVLVLEEAGRACLPEPLLATTAVVGPLLAEAGTDEQRARWLPAIARGDATAAAGDAFVPDADVADLVVVLRAGAASLSERGPARRVPCVDRSVRLCALDAFHDPLEAAAAARAGLRATAAVAAVLNGVSMRLVELTLEHVRQRHQFGRPVGAFQVVKHRCADMHVAVETARAAAWYAAYAIARGEPDADVATSVAKVAAADAHALVNREALQLHAGIGFTWEHDLHLWLKRGLVLAPLFGTASEHRDRLARHVIEREVPHA